MRKISGNVKLFVIIISVLMLITLTGCGNDTADQSNVVADDVDWEFFNQLAEEFIDAIVRGDFDAAVGMFDETMAGVVDVEMLQTAWEDDILTLAGAFIRIHDIENGVQDGYYISGVIMRHENSGFGWNIVFSDDGLIAGLFTGGTIPLPDDIENEQATELEEPVQRVGFVDYPIIVGEGTAFPLNGILSMPDDVADQVPAVVIVHGSGASDMNGTIPGLSNAPYREIAEFLAVNGIATIRYDKRTFSHGSQMVQELGGSLTVWEETIEDVLLATEILRADSRIDSDRIYVIGHSLGGILAPRIYAEGGDFAGLILMGATSRPLLEVLVEQARASIYTAIELGLSEEEDMAEMLDDVDEIVELLERLLDMSDEEAKEASVPMFGGSVMAYYFKDLMVHSFENYAVNLAVPVMVMQGGRDFQIRADVDFAVLQEMFAERDDVSFHLYDELNHSFMRSTASNFIEHAESMRTPGHVYIPALQDIVDWILGH